MLYFVKNSESDMGKWYTISFIMGLLVLVGCSSTKEVLKDEHKPSYELVFPLHASAQDVIRLEGYRFLSSTMDSPASLLMLSNPVRSDGFIDIAFAMTNNSTKTVVLKRKDLLIKISKKGKVNPLSKEDYAKGDVYQKPKNLDSLIPKMELLGCSPRDNSSNIEPSALNQAQKWVWDRYKRYPFKDDSIYFETLHIEKGETKGGILRIKLPVFSVDQDGTALYIKVDTGVQEAYKFRFMMQGI